MTEDDKEMKRLIELRCKEDGGCLLWQDCMAGGSSPSMRMKQKNINVRRRYYELTKGPIPDGLQVAVTCECSRCLRHIEAQTGSQIRQRMTERGLFSAALHGPRVAAGKRRNSRFSEELVEEIRTSEEPPEALAQRTGMSLMYLKKVQRGVQRRRLVSHFAGLGART